MNHKYKTVMKVLMIISLIGFSITTLLNIIELNLKYLNYGKTPLIDLLFVKEYDGDLKLYDTLKFIQLVVIHSIRKLRIKRLYSITLVVIIAVFSLSLDYYIEIIVCQTYLSFTFLIIAIVTLSMYSVISLSTNENGIFE